MVTPGVLRPAAVATPAGPAPAPQPTPPLLAAWATVNVLAALLLFATPGTSDMGIWTRWMSTLGKHGLVDGFALTRGDYPPLVYVPLWWCEQFANVSPLSRTVALKLLLCCAWLASGAVFWWVARTRLCPRAAATAALALLLPNMALGYLDVLYAPLLIAALYAMLEGKVAWAALGWSLAALLKWQPLILMPFLLVPLLQQPVSQRKLAASQAMLCCVAVFAGSLLWFGTPVLQALHQALNHTFLSGNALNFNWLLTHALHVFAPATYGPLDQGLNHYVNVTSWQLTLGPRVVFALTYAWAWFVALRTRADTGRWLRLALAGYLAYFCFNVGVHENHLFVAVLAAFVAGTYGLMRWAEVAAFSCVLLVNLALFYGLTGQELRQERLLAGVDLTSVCAAAFTLGSALWLWRELTYAGSAHWTSSERPLAAAPGESTATHR